MSVLIHFDVVWGLVFIKLGTLSGLRWMCNPLNFELIQNLVKITIAISKKNFVCCQNSYFWNFKTAWPIFHCFGTSKCSIQASSRDSLLENLRSSLILLSLSFETLLLTLDFHHLNGFS
jgi:hypothetical protein